MEKIKIIIDNTKNFSSFKKEAEGDFVTYIVSTVENFNVENLVARTTEIFFGLSHENIALRETSNSPYFQTILPVLEDLSPEDTLEEVKCLDPELGEIILYTEGKKSFSSSNILFLTSNTQENECLQQVILYLLDKEVLLVCNALDAFVKPIFKSESLNFLASFREESSFDAQKKIYEQFSFTLNKGIHEQIKRIVLLTVLAITNEAQRKLVIKRLLLVSMNLMERQYNYYVALVIYGVLKEILADYPNGYIDSLEHYESFLFEENEATLLTYLQMETENKHIPEQDSDDQEEFEEYALTVIDMSQWTERYLNILSNNQLAQEDKQNILKNYRSLLMNACNQKYEPENDCATLTALFEKIYELPNDDILALCENRKKKWHHFSQFFSIIRAYLKFPEDSDSLSDFSVFDDENSMTADLELKKMPNDYDEEVEKEKKAVENFQETYQVLREKNWIPNCLKTNFSVQLNTSEISDKILKIKDHIKETGFFSKRSQMSWKLIQSIDDEQKKWLKNFELVYTALYQLEPQWIKQNYLVSLDGFNETARYHLIQKHMKKVPSRSNKVKYLLQECVDGKTGEIDIETISKKMEELFFHEASRSCSLFGCFSKSPVITQENIQTKIDELRLEERNRSVRSI